jgi:hypothetical protein
MEPKLAEKADAYLDGALPREEAFAFERELARSSDAVKALSEELAFRDLLRNLPPLQPPEELEERIWYQVFHSQAFHSRRLRSSKSSGEQSPAPRWRAALSGASWSLRGPAIALAAPLEGARPMASGLSQLQWMLGPLGVRRAGKIQASESKPLWRRALAWVRR